MPGCSFSPGMLMPQILAQLSPSHFRFLLILIHQLLRAILSKNTFPPPPLLFLTGLFFYVFPLDHEGRTRPADPMNSEIWHILAFRYFVRCVITCMIDSHQSGLPIITFLLPCVPGELSITGLSPLT